MKKRKMHYNYRANTVISSNKPIYGYTVISSNKPIYGYTVISSNKPIYG